MFSIEISDERDACAADDPRMRQLASAIARDAGIADGSLSIAIVDDPTIHELNRRYLEHDYPTDVPSFVLERDAEHLEAEVIVSHDTAARVAASFHWTPADELLLYVVHGMLHAVGYDDTTDDARAQMRAAERQYLATVGLQVRGSGGVPGAKGSGC